MDNLNYGVVGNCRSAALISQYGSIDWCCMPDFDSPSVFARLLDYEKGGYFSLEVNDSYTINQKYINNTNVLRTSFSSPEGAFDIIDFMPRYQITDREYFRPAEIHRLIQHISGKPKVRIQYNPILNYARDPVAHVIQDDHIRTYSTDWPTDCIYLYSSFDLNDILEKREIEINSDHYLLVSYNQKVIDMDLNRVYLEFHRTKVYWLNWTNRSKKFKSYNEYIQRSLLVLRIMSYDSTGAILAALTTSLPETIGEVRNWDYRFCWLRDASMSVDTLLGMGHYNAARRFLGFIMRILKSKSDTFMIMYGIRGERDLTETELSNLSGYENSRPVRVGNAAYLQKQNDVFGYLLNVIHRYYEYFAGTLDEIEDIWEIVRNIIQTVTTHWEKPDKGIWEFRGEGRHFVFSKVMSWVAMDRAAKIARLLHKNSYADDWQGLATEIKADIYKNGWNEELQTFTQSYESTSLDASLLLIAEYGFITTEDEKFTKTVTAVKDALFYNGLMYRYTTMDDFGKPKSAFTICTFWLIKALYNTGRKDEAEKIFNDLLSCSNHVGLFSEDIDFHNRRLLGNFPQAYSHLALISTASLFSEEKITSRFIKP
ncbi:MAG TPA: glycoside hydrolase family 15 protein [Bacteroidales bacterium]|nr:glycoside hydrolase family 15 protein [Bacteroidales bacterium]